MSSIITKRATDYSQWYIDVCRKADLADYSDVRGCMVIKPHGYAIWENMQKILDNMFKETGHKNAYFPLFIPKSFFCKEAEHIDGFAKECAVITHYRLKNDPNGKGVIVDPDAKLEEELIVRPTSETIIWSTYRKWIQSYRDLPLLINQWANVVRWEMRTRLFLRTTEFLWQEGHTAHATAEEAEIEATKMLEVYRVFVEDYMAIPVYTGKKTEREKFAGAVHTYTIEALMQDAKALQAGTSHNLGQKFAKAFDVKYQSKEGKLEYVYATSWGVSTRLMGALIMSHSDDSGLIIPPRLASIQVIIVPIFKKEEELNIILNKIKDLSHNWKGLFTFEIDKRTEYNAGYKFADWELKGIPLRIEIGPKDLEKDTVVLARRDKSKGEEGAKITIAMSDIMIKVPQLLNDIQQNLFNKALNLREQHTYYINSYQELKDLIDTKPGFYVTWFAENDDFEVKMKDELGVTVRCIPFSLQGGEGKCFATGQITNRKVILAISY